MAAALQRIVVALRADGGYLAGRAIQVVGKPLAIWIFSHVTGSALASELSVVFVVSAIGVLLASADTHRRYYELRFGAVAHTAATTYSKYVLCAAGVALVVGLSGAVYQGYRTMSALHVLAFFVFFLSEKLADDVLRFQLFSADLANWGRLALQRGSLWTVASAVLYLAAPDSSVVLVFVFAAINLAVFAQPLNKRFLALAVARQLRRGDVKALIEHLLYSKSTWIIAILSIGYSYSERLIVLTADAAKMPQYYLVVSCFGAISMVIDFFYVSYNRRNFLNRAIRISSAAGDRKFWLAAGCGLALATAGLAAVQLSLDSMAVVSFAEIAMVAGIQVLIGVGQVPTNILYWEDRGHALMRIESAFFACFMLFLIVALAFFASAGLPALLAVLFMLHLLRASLLVRAALKAGR